MDKQHITVELFCPAVVFSVSFGKFEKSHACNLRKFSVYGGMECDRMHLLCEGCVLSLPSHLIPLFACVVVWLTTQSQRVFFFDTKWEENHFRAAT